MRIQIEPVELGKIELKTIVEQGRIGVLVQAESQMTKELLQIHLHEMKEILEEQGLEVAGFQVDVKEQQKDFLSKNFLQVQNLSLKDCWKMTMTGLSSARPKQQDLLTR